MSCGCYRNLLFRDVIYPKTDDIMFVLQIKDDNDFRCYGCEGGCEKQKRKKKTVISLK